MLLMLLALRAVLPAGHAAAAEQGPASAAAGPRWDVVDYSAEFFDRYRPATALDMVDQLPGFSLDDGGNQRGFGGTSGNILIDGRRPTAKQDQPSDLLDRIPADMVERIEIIRGAVRDIDMQGQVEVANVILRADAPAVVRWEAGVSHNTDFGTMPFKGNVSMSDRWLAVDYNAGLDMERFARLDLGGETEFDATGTRLASTADEGIDKGLQLIGNLNGTAWAGETRVHFNAELGFERGDDEFASFSVIDVVTGDVATELRSENRDENQLELGVDLERTLASEITGKLILLYTREDEKAAESQRRFDPTGTLLLTRLKDAETLESEAIARTEFMWSGWSGHSPQLNLEAAYNLLENAEDEFRDIGDGPVEVVVPGADTRVEEFRGDLLLRDIWSVAAFELEFGLGAEVSRLEQTGDSVLARNFFFLKPYTIVSYAPSESRQTRARIERKVAQLDFEDFVSATVFEDDELALGNPNLRPETTWVAELGHEQRFGELAVVKLTAFHHWISDVQDLLPLTPTEEAPGNIGSGRRWGLVFESTLPLDRLGLTDARLDLQAYWQDSSVTDPVVGEPRVLSAVGGDWFEGGLMGSDIEYNFSVDYRQDLERQRMAWGWNMSLRAERLRFKVNELEIRDEDMQLNLFAETTRWLDWKVRIEAKNLLDAVESRERILFAELRGLSGLDRRELRDYTEGREIELTVSGSF